jgi:diguanylate cyclase (GGDEF)-like protein
LTQALARLNRHGQLAVLCLDLDGFKAINDTLGHPAGDELLKGVTGRLKRCIGEGDLLARLGGDEFAIIQVNADQLRAMELASEIIAAISRTFRIDDQDVNVGVSIGVAIAPDHSTDQDVLLRNADIALLRAKMEGRNTARAFEVGMDARLRERRLLEMALREAIEHDQFEMHYQPLMNLETNRITSFEALIRWRHPNRGLVAPLEFLPLAEETGLIVPIGDFALRRACQDAVLWPRDVGVSVNVSSVQFKNGALSLNVVSALAESGLAANRLDLEITETALLRDTEIVLQTLTQLRAMGVRISMDDFGTGYSSLSYLRCFPFDRIKIDRSFIKDLGEENDCSAIVKAVANLGAALGMATTAEGIETAEQLEQARAHGCTEGQGRYCGRPRSAKELPGLFRYIAAVA